MHYLDNALLGVHGLGKLWLGGVWLEHTVVSGYKGITWSHAVSRYIMGSGSGSGI